jgi:hypothetical protein
MKKFLIALVVLLVLNLSCKKERGLCACSIPVNPTLNLVLKNSAGEDLLNSTTTSSYSKNDIQLFYKDASGVSRDISFSIRPSFTYENIKFDYNQLSSSEIVKLANLSTATFYLKLGNNPTYEIVLGLGQDKMIDKIYINNQEANKEASINKYFLAGNIFYLVK